MLFKLLVVNWDKFPAHTGLDFFLSYLQHATNTLSTQESFQDYTIFLSP